MIEKIALKKALDGILIEARFQKKSNSWYMSGDDAVVVFDLQKSDFGAYFYINIGVSFKSLVNEGFPKINKCHISMRADRLVEGDADQLALGLDMNEGDECALSIAVDIVKNKILPIVVNFGNIEALRDFYSKGVLKNSLMHWQARELLESGSAV